jgi:hypothetical protein
MDRAVDSEQNEIGADLAEPSETVDQFCRIERMSRSTFYKLQRAKLGPRVTEVVLPPEPGIKHGKGLHFIRISAQAHREWRAMIAVQQRGQEAWDKYSPLIRPLRYTRVFASLVIPRRVLWSAPPTMRLYARSLDYS